MSKDSEKEAQHPDVGMRMAWHLEHTGLTQAEYAKSINAGRSALANWVTGLQRPSVNAVMAMHDRYGITPDFVYLGDASRLPEHLNVAWMEFQAKQNAFGKSDD